MSSTCSFEEDRDRKQSEDNDARGQKRKLRDDDEEAGTSQELKSILTSGLSGKQSSLCGMHLSMQKTSSLQFAR